MTTGPRLCRLFAVLALLLVVSSWPALGGSWVYDDWLMLDHPLLDGPEDLLGTFAHNSTDYQRLKQEAGAAIQGRPTYRPLSMLSLGLVNVLVGSQPWVHHAVSLSLHLVTLLLLGLLATRRGSISWPAGLLLGIFAFHPALGEAYLWINGRSDVLAGAALAATALLLQRSVEGGEEGGRRRAAAAAALGMVLLGGALAKETFLPAAFFLLAATIFAGAPWVAGLARRARLVLPAMVMLAIAAAAMLGARAATMDTSAAGPPGTGSALSLLTPLLGRAPRLLALGAETLALPVPRTMRLLCWELAQPWSAAQLALVIALALLAFLLILRGRPRPLLLLLGAAMTLLPVGLVADSFWLGFDRYLYLSACLILIAALPWAGGATLDQLLRGSSRTARGLALLGAASCLLLLGVAQRATARNLASQPAFVWSILAQRPEEPTGYLLASRQALAEGDPELAGRLLDRQPPVGELPPALAHQLAAVQLAAGRPAAAAALVERTAARYPDDPNVRFDLLALRGAQGRWPEAVQLAGALLSDPRRREAVVGLVRGWLFTGLVPPGPRAELELLLPRQAPGEAAADN
ncbi:MAG: hypothetical protein FJ125_03140 [Deltaproteobacteria bacterium]|nr:hypothetical protein [Deltaproteobacteria bacterium]